MFHRILPTAVGMIAAGWLVRAALAGGDCNPPLTPPVVNVGLAPGGSTTLQKCVCLEPVPPVIDICFSVDLTESMSGEAANLRNQILQIINTIRSGTGSDVRFALVTYEDYPATYTSCGYTGQYSELGAPYRVVAPIGSSDAQVQAGVLAMQIRGGGDAPESYTRVLWEAAQPDSGINFRPGAAKFLINFSDNVPHDCNIRQGIASSCLIGYGSTGVDPGRDGLIGTADDLDFQDDALAELIAAQVKLVEIHSGDANQYCAWQTWAAQTGGLARQINADGSVPGGNLGTFLLNLILQASSVVRELRLEADPNCQLDITFNPPVAGPINVTNGATVCFQETITLPPGVIVPPGGEVCCTVRAFADGAEVGTQTVCVEPNQPPSCDIGGPYSAVCTGGSVQVQLDGSRSADPNGDPLSYLWSSNCPGASFDNPRIVNPILTFTPGSGCGATCQVSLSISDGGSPPQICSTNVTVRDTTAPQLLNCSAAGGNTNTGCNGTVNFSATLRDECCANAAALNATAQLVSGSATLGAVTLNRQQINPREARLTGSVAVQNLATCPVVVRINFSGQDCCNNAAATCFAEAQVLDVTPPVIHCPAPIVVENGSFLCDGQLGGWLTSAWAEDNCTPSNQITISYSSPTCGFPPGVTTVTFTATDRCGNSASCTSTVTVTSAAAGTVAASGVSEAGSLLFYPRVELRWNEAGELLQDTFISVNNQHPDQRVHIQWYFINGDAPRLPQGGERGHAGCNWLDVQITLTPEQPTYWSVATGEPINVSPFAVLDPGWPPGRPDPDRPGERVMRGHIVGWAVNQAGEEIRWNYLTGSATVVNYAGSYAWSYLPWAYQTRCVADGQRPLDCLRYDESGACCEARVIIGKLDMDGFQYDYNPAFLTMDFVGVGSNAFARAGRPVTLTDLDLTLVGTGLDLRRDNLGPVRTQVRFDVWNQNEVRLAGVQKCMTCWDRTLLAQLGTPSPFLYSTLQTDRGKARIDGAADAACAESQSAALIGVLQRVVRFGGQRYEATSSNLVGEGFERSTLHNDVIAGPEEVRGADCEPR